VHKVERRGSVSLEIAEADSEAMGAEA